MLAYVGKIIGSKKWSTSISIKINGMEQKHLG